MALLKSVGKDCVSLVGNAIQQPKDSRRPSRVCVPSHMFRPRGVSHLSLSSPYKKQNFSLSIGVQASAATEDPPAPSSAPPPPPGGGPTTIVRINLDTLKAGGLEVAKQPKAGIQGFQDSVSKQYLPINMEFPGLHVLNLDPPIFYVKGLLEDSECEGLIEAAKISGMKKSKIGTQGGSSTDAPKDMRTSSTLAVNSEVLGSQPTLEKRVKGLYTRAQKLILADSMPSWDKSQGRKFAKPGGPGEVAFELPQIARYRPGEHFLSHEDAFPFEAAKEKGYQRRATLLCYLNTVSEGGGTNFDVIDLKVQPKQGDALLFFPSFQNGMPDHRTLHTAEDAVEGEEKWVTQTWISIGVEETSQAETTSAAEAQKLFEERAEKRGKKPGSRGFGTLKAHRKSAKHLVTGPQAGGGKDDEPKGFGDLKSKKGISVNKPKAKKGFGKK